MKTYNVKIIDAFSEKAFGGNPAGVVTEASSLTASEMQQIAKELNLSETTFVLPPNDRKADFLVRYFAPQSEVPVAGHATIATVHALVEEKKIRLDTLPKQVYLETVAGILPVEINLHDSNTCTITLTMAVPKFESTMTTYDEIATMLGTDINNIDQRYAAQKVSTGLYWFVVPLLSLQTIHQLRPNLAAIADFSCKEKVTGIQVFTTETDDPSCDVHVRTFAPFVGIPEDPVCGTSNSCIGAFIVENEVFPTKGQIQLTSEQGIELGRTSRVTINVQGLPHAIYEVKITGIAVTVLEGTLHF